MFDKYISLWYLLCHYFIYNRFNLLLCNLSFAWSFKARQIIDTLSGIGLSVLPEEKWRWTLQKQHEIPWSGFFQCRVYISSALCSCLLSDCVPVSTGQWHLVRYSACPSFLSRFSETVSSRLDDDWSERSWLPGWGFIHNMSFFSSSLTKKGK